MKKISGLLSMMLVACSLYAVETDLPKDIKGVWLPISGTEAPYSAKGIKEAVKRCSDIGINTIYFAVWNQSMTNFKLSHKFLKKYPFVKMNAKFSKIDPLKKLIKKAHAKKIRVVAWFEYGFATSYNDPDVGGYILKEKPEWKAIDNAGKLVTKNNFQWMNAFDPEVQEFMLNLIMDLVKNYDVDGIQGDDRMPALPVNAGYDKKTVEKYKSEHNGAEPPQDYNNADWIQWRCNILNDFMKQIHDTVENYNDLYTENISIEMAPSVYPWSKENYLQDWPTWVKNNWLDRIYPQIYRYSIEAYRDTLIATKNLFEKGDLKKLYPGVLIGVGGKTTANKGILKEMMDENRSLGKNGEVFFYYESLTDNEVADIIKNEYKAEAEGAKPKTIL